jgi:hypothetical protein
MCPVDDALNFNEQQTLCVELRTVCRSNHCMSVVTFLRVQIYWYNSFSIIRMKSFTLGVSNPMTAGLSDSKEMLSNRRLLLVMVDGMHFISFLKIYFEMSSFLL